MKDMPKKASELSTHGEDAAAIEKFILKYWKGLDCVSPNNYENFLNGYTDCAGQEEWEENEREKQEAYFDGFNDFHFIKTLSLPSVAYDDMSQGRSPLRSLIGAIMAYGFERGRIDSEEKIAERERMKLMKVILKFFNDNAE